MVGEQANTGISLLSHISSQDRNSPVHSEKQQKHVSPLPVIAPSQSHQEQEKIAVVNTLHAGAYALSLAYNQLCRRALGKAKRDSQGNVIISDIIPYTLGQFHRNID